MLKTAIAVLLVSAAQIAIGGAAQAQFIAGLNPAERPAGAPVITEFIKDGDWYARALRGVSPPYPASLRFLEHQGAWFNPFIGAGMTGPYDIREWHGAE